MCVPRICLLSDFSLLTLLCAPVCLVRNVTTLLRMLQTVFQASGGSAGQPASQLADQSAREPAGRPASRPASERVSHQASLRTIQPPTPPASLPASHTTFDWELVILLASLIPPRQARPCHHWRARHHTEKTKDPCLCKALGVTLGATFFVILSMTGGGVGQVCV